MSMVLGTWKEFADADPGLARFGNERLSDSVAYLSTIRGDGGPRLHPVTVHIFEGTCFVYMAPTSPKAVDLHRDPRYALHCSVENADGGQGEFGMRGSVVKIDDASRRDRLFAVARTQGFRPADHYVLFELKIEIAFSTTYEIEGSPRRRNWKPT